jgi:Domain of unknown function (DUF1993)
MVFVDFHHESNFALTVRIPSRRRQRQAERHVTVLQTNAKFSLPQQDPHSMTISMYKTSVPIFVQFLTSMSAILDKSAMHCEAKKIEPATLLNMRLFPDMFPLVRQLRAVTDHAISGTARLAGATSSLFQTMKRASPRSRTALRRQLISSRASSRCRSTAPRTRRSLSSFRAGSASSKGRRSC